MTKGINKKMPFLYYKMSIFKNWYQFNIKYKKNGINSNLNDREGHLQGQKPFIHDAWYPMPEKEFKDFNLFMRLVIDVLLNNPDQLFSFYCQNIQN